MGDFKDHLKQIASLIIDDVHSNYESYRVNNQRQEEPYHKVIQSAREEYLGSESRTARPLTASSS